MRRKSGLLFATYFSEWVEHYKRGAVRPVTLKKYLMTQKRLSELAPSLLLSELDWRSYQAIINAYALTHEKQTVLDFHRHLRSSLLDALDDGLIAADPSRRTTIKGKAAAEKKLKYLSVAQLSGLLSVLELEPGVPSWDWFILLVAKTGVRFAEGLAYTPSDLDGNQLKISRTWDYKNPDGGFADTKNVSSRRVVSIDAEFAAQLATLGAGAAPGAPLFVNGRVFNSNINDRLTELCKLASVPAISIHGLRHTHASALLHAGVSIASISKRLGHSNINTTQSTYLHIVRELEEKDNEKVLAYLERGLSESLGSPSGVDRYQLMTHLGKWAIDYGTPLIRASQNMNVWLSAADSVIEFLGGDQS